MGSAPNAIEVPVFIDTSLGTHILISVSPDLTAAEFNRKFETMHLNCFPRVGSIKVDGLMVKKRCHLYHLPASMPIKHVFQGSNKAWFLYTQVHPLNNKITSPSTPKSELVRGGGLSENRREISCKKSRKKAKVTDFRTSSIEPSIRVGGLSENSCKKSRKKTKVTDFRTSSIEPADERMSGSVSVSGIIKKYFFVYDDEVTSSNSKPPSYAPETPPTISKVGGSREKKRPRPVGTRVIVAANNLGISSSDKKSVISLCRDKCDKFSAPKSSSIVRHPVFEIGEG